MKKLFYLLVFILASCNQSSKTNSDNRKALTKIMQDTLAVNNTDKIKRQIVPDSLVSFEDTLYANLQPLFRRISENEFEVCKRKYKTTCAADTGSLINGSVLNVISNCNETCETYLAERNTNRKMLLPSDYDQGVLDMLFSPNCTKLLVCSSYDGPVSEEYYQHRAEFFILNVTVGIGLNSMKPAFKYYAKGWSIDDLTWIDNKTIALKTYVVSKGGDNSEMTYEYFKADVSK